MKYFTFKTGVIWHNILDFLVTFDSKLVSSYHRAKSGKVTGPLNWLVNITLFLFMDTRCTFNHMYYICDY